MLLWGANSRQPLPSGDVFAMLFLRSVGGRPYGPSFLIPATHSDRVFTRRGDCDSTQSLAPCPHRNLPPIRDLFFGIWRIDGLRTTHFSRRPEQNRGGLLLGSAKGGREYAPVAAWDTWNVIAYTGLSEIYTPDYFQMKRAFEAAAPYMYTYLTIGTVSLIGFIVSIVLARRK